MDVILIIGVLVVSLIGSFLGGYVGAITKVSGKPLISLPKLPLAAKTIPDALKDEEMTLEEFLYGGDVDDNLEGRL